MTDDLRLRTARALNVKMYYEEEFPGERYYYYAEGERKHQPMPAYGESWASCAEIDAACKERGWEWQCYTLDGNVVMLMSRRASTARGGIIEATASTFPAAFALAFCEAVETNGE